jgi:hypothetical protein
MILLDHATTGDGTVAALRVLASLVRSGKPASELLHVFDPVPQLLRNVRYEGGKPLDNPQVKAVIADAEALLVGKGRLVIRPSGTEPVIRVMAEGDDQKQVEDVVDAICEAVPELGTTQASMIAEAINSHLGAKVDWRRNSDDKKKRRRDAILSYEDRPPFFTSLEIPLHNTHTKVTFGDRLTIAVNRPMADMKRLVLDVSLRGMPRGKQRLLREIADGKRKLASSRLVERDGEWYWHVPFTFESSVRSDRIAELWPVTDAKKDGKQHDRPFMLRLLGRVGCSCERCGWVAPGQGGSDRGWRSRQKPRARPSSRPGPRRP